MAPRCTIILVSWIACFHAISAYPSQGPDLHSRQSVDCTSTNPEAFYDASCWATLDLTNWLNSWKPPKICDDADNGINCCTANEEWSTCFLRLGKGDSGFNCSQLSINTNVCAYNGQLAPDLDPSIRAQVRYVLRTISGARSANRKQGYTTHHGL